MDENEDTTRTVGDMTGEDLAGMIAGGVVAALEQAGVGRAQSTPVVGLQDETREEEKPAYGVSLRARFAFERSSEIIALPTQEARDQRIAEYMGFTDWARALTNGDREKADLIAVESRGYTVEEARQLTTTVGGAALVPTILQGPIIEKRALRDKLTPLAMPNRSSSGVLDLTAEATIIAASGTVEAAAITPQDLTYDPVSLKLKKATAVVSTSREVLTDAAQSMQLVQNFSRQAGRAFGIYNNTQNLTGDGVTTNFTAGIIPGATAITGSGGAMTTATFTDLIFGMDPNFRDNVVFLTNTKILGFASLLTDLNGARVYPNARVNQTVPVTGDSPPASGFGQIEGIPVLEFLDTDIVDLVILANMDFFAALLDDNIRVETTTEGGTAFLDDLQLWKFVQRQDGAVTLPDGFVKSDAAVLAPV